MKYELYGIREELEYGGYDNSSKRYDVEDLLATFYSEKLAKKYVEASLLKAAKINIFIQILDVENIGLKKNLS